MEIREDIRLAPYTTLKVGGVARYFADAATDQDVIEALRWARKRALPLFVLGGGSNLLVSDTGFDGLVLHITIDGIEAQGRGEKRIFSAGAGVEWDTLVALAVQENCAGVECLSGIPGSVGGTPVQNVGAYGQDVSETIVRVCAVDADTKQQVEFDAATCGFSYRQSRFNGSDAGRYIVTRVDFALHPGGTPKIAYADLKHHFSTESVKDGSHELSAVREAVLKIRRTKGMLLDENDADSHSAGSFFKNPVVSLEMYRRIAANSTVSVPHYAAGAEEVKLSAAWLIEQSGINKGFTLGKAAISSKHTLALVNLGGATASDLLRLKEFVQGQVMRRFNVELLPEPVTLGFGPPLRSGAGH